jgi:hypothetical protein
VINKTLRAKSARSGALFSYCNSRWYSAHSSGASDPFQQSGILYNNNMVSPENLAVGTRLHLGSASAPPSDEKYKELMQTFSDFATSFGAQHIFVAVDATPKFDNYSLVDVIRSVTTNPDITSGNSTTASPTVEVIPVTPWNKFVPALNAIVSKAASLRASHCLFCSAETKTSPESVLELLEYLDDDTLVAGAVLPGHDYKPKSLQPLNGSTTPWNTLAIWDISKLALTGFPLVADGLHVNTDGSPVAAGVEEVSTIALIQSILTPQKAKAKLVPLPDCQWNQTFEDEGRRKWHEAKMKSKVERPAKHLKLLQLSDKGVVEQC